MTYGPGPVPPIYPPQVETPAIPASGGTVINTSGFPIIAMIKPGGQAVTAVIADFAGNEYVTVVTSTAAPATIFIPACFSITMTFAASPTWTWQAL